MVADEFVIRYSIVEVDHIYYEIITPPQMRALAGAGETLYPLS